jgi:2-phosphosulfolactate phosphatase
MPQVEVCFAPPMFPAYAREGISVVVVDVFRATSAIVTALHHGVAAIVPVGSLQQARSYLDKGFLAGGERNGEVAEGFAFGNSPFSYMNPDFRGREVVLTTTNGTQAIEMARGYTDRISIGAFLNLSALAQHLRTEGRDVVILCAGWKDRFNMEDSLFAGALTDRLVTECGYTTECDSATASMLVYRSARTDLKHFLRGCSHRRRLAHLNLEADVDYCLRVDICPVVPVLHNGKLLLQQ